MKILLIRHGQTQPNIERTYSGWNDIPLNKTGIKQAKKVAKFLQGLSVDKIYCSDLKRCRQFAGIAFKGSAIETYKELREINFGAFEGLSHEEIMESFPEQYIAWLKDPLNKKIPKGEDVKNVMKRTIGFLKKITKTAGHSTIAIVSHSGPIKSILAYLKRTKNFWKIDVNNASITVLEMKNRQFKIIKENNTSFL
ncbi:MAG TPA: histidine phosphatase family protein [Candidatus Omnitrophota bacterium]|nr:histidine phosphatase family protein [Candidatus Omnitrophota bacterium]